MAHFLKPFRFAWRELDEALNKIADAINFNAPLEGTKIQLDEKGGQGTSINWTDKGSKSSDDQPQNAATTSAVVWHGVAWQDVDVVDSNCNRSTITVLVYTGNSGDSISIS